MMNSRVKEYRTKMRLSRAELAKRAGTTERYVAFIEDGQRKPSLVMAMKLAKALRTSVDALFLPINCT